MTLRTLLDRTQGNGRKTCSREKELLSCSYSTQAASNRLIHDSNENDSNVIYWPSSEGLHLTGEIKIPGKPQGQCVEWFSEWVRPQELLFCSLKCRNEISDLWQPLSMGSSLRSSHGFTRLFPSLYSTFLSGLASFPLHLWNLNMFMG